MKTFYGLGFPRFRKFRPKILDQLSNVRVLFHLFTEGEIAETPEQYQLQITALSSSLSLLNKIHHQYPCEGEEEQRRQKLNC